MSRIVHGGEEAAVEHDCIFEGECELVVAATDTTEERVRNAGTTQFPIMMARFTS